MDPSLQTRQRLRLALLRPAQFMLVRADGRHPRPLLDRAVLASRGVRSAVPAPLTAELAGSGAGR